MSRLGQALQDELNGTDIGNVSLDALSTGVTWNAKGSNFQGKPLVSEQDWCGTVTKNGHA